MLRLLQSVILPLLPWSFGPALDPPRSARSIAEAAERTYYDNAIAVLTSRDADAKCTLENVSVRRAWDDISVDERLDYINAVKCITTIPSRTDPKLCPGARTLYDDFVYTHINQTMFTHHSALLLPWHRQFIWAFEEALRNECGYTGSLPYWPWERHSSNQALSPIWADSPSSLGGNGAGGGGGCVDTGPFTSFIANIGPISNDHHDGTVYNPRCVTRDFQQEYSTMNLTYDALASLYQHDSIHQFEPELEVGIHAGSHFFVGGEMQGIFGAPVDIAFYILHSQIDRVWTIWQMLDWEERRTALHGTLTIENSPPSENGTVHSPMHMLNAGGEMVIGDVMDPLSGIYCYMYR